MIMLSSNRIRSIIADCKTERDITQALRNHKVKYTFSTDTGFLSVRIPCKKGYIRIYRTASRSRPFLVSSVPPVPFMPVPVLHNDY